MLSDALIQQILSFGHAGVLLWVMFEMRDIRREHSTHLKTHHGEKGG